ncbi:MAG: SDR family NAD(P)-dependent oxidoreductase [Nitratireductor sp.]
MAIRAPNSLFDLSGKIACVTGASSGLGRRAADILLSAGARVVGVARRESELASWVADAGEGSAYVTADISNLSGNRCNCPRCRRKIWVTRYSGQCRGYQYLESADNVTPEGWQRTPVSTCLPRFSWRRPLHLQ